MTSFITVILRQSFIVPTPSLSAVSVLSNHSVFHIGCCVLCRVLSCAPTAPSLPPDNLALSFYIPRSDCGLYYCFPLSAPKDIPSLSDFSLPCPFRKGLYLPRYLNSVFCDIFYAFYCGKQRKIAYFV